MADSERVSRQELVVPPRQSNFSIIVGACVCACAGFGLVWKLGIGRSTHPDQHPVGTATTQLEAPPAQPNEVWQASPKETETDTDRYQNRPVSFESTEEIVPAGRNEQPLSRFSTPTDLEPLPESNSNDLLPVEESVEGSDTTTFPQSTQAVPPDDDVSVMTAPDLETEGKSEPDVTTPSNDTVTEKDEVDSVPSGSVPSNTDLDQIPPTLPPSIANTDVEPPASPSTTASPEETASTGTTDSDESATKKNPFIAESSTITDLQETETGPSNSQTESFPADDTTDNATITETKSGLSESTELNRPSQDQPLTNAFAAQSQPQPQNTPSLSSNPSLLGPQSLTGPQVASPFESSSTIQPNQKTSSGTGPIGGGKPGSSQLEGVQTPQVTVEKRGPRDIQVGKPVRYEIHIRNVGTAVANNVMIHDTIPTGTHLIATTPPASPDPMSADINSGGLIWHIGKLEPGASTKVAMEVMPEAEGEIGSVASVTFRAEATMRSRATRPALSVSASPPEPVLIGEDITAEILVSNPGTGTSTGIIIVGTLPEGVQHPAGSELEFDVGRLEPGESRTIDLALKSASPGVHAMTVVARADGQLKAETSIPLEITAPMLELAADMPGRRYLQRPAVCKITMHNTGTAPAMDVELASQLPPGMKFVRANNTGFYDERHHRVLWSLEELPAGKTGTVEMVVMPVALGPQKMITAARNPAGLSDQIANQIEVEGLASLAFQITDSEDPIEVGGQTEYVIRVGNQGTKPASGVRLQATLLGDLEPLDARGPAGHRIENLTVIFDPLTTLVPTEEAIYKIQIRGQRAGDHRIQVQLTSDEHTTPITKEEVTRVYADR